MATLARILVILHEINSVKQRYFLKVNHEIFSYE